MTTQPQDIQYVNTNRVPCDGGDNGLGHPRVWLQIPVETKTVTCPYCDRVFVRQDTSETQ